jgi:hypothetical protein
VASTNETWDVGVPGMKGTPGIEQFGNSLAAGNFGKSGQADLAIGAPFETVSGQSGAGTAHVLYGSTTGLTVTGNQLWSQAGAVAGDPAANEHFGFAVA